MLKIVYKFRRSGQFYQVLKRDKPFCSKRATLAAATRAFEAMSARVIPFSTRRRRKLSAISRATASGCGAFRLSNTDNKNV